MFRTGSTFRRLLRNGRDSWDIGWLAWDRLRSGRSFCAKLPFRMLFVHRDLTRWDHPFYSLLWRLRLAYRNIEFFGFDPMRPREGSLETSDMLKQAIRRTSPDIIFGYGNPFTLTEVEYIVAHGIKVGASIEGFTSFNHGGWGTSQLDTLRMLQLHDWYFVSHRPHVETLIAEGIKAFHLPHWYDPYWYKPLKVDKIYDVLFSGTCRDASREYRYQWLSSIGKRFRLALVGPPEDFAGIPNATLLGEVVRPSQMNLILNQAVIVLGNDYLTGEVEKHNHYPDQRIYYTLTHQIKHRTYCALGSGACYVVEDHPEIGREFQDGQEVVLWKDEDDLMHKIEHLLRNRDEALRIGMNGYRRAREEYPTDIAIDRLMRTIAQGIATSKGEVYY